MLNSCRSCFHFCWMGSALQQGCLALIGSHKGHMMFQVSAAGGCQGWHGDNLLFLMTNYREVCVSGVFWWVAFSKLSPCWNILKLQPLSILKNITFLCRLRKRRKWEMFIWSISWFPGEKLRRLRREITDLKIWSIKIRPRERFIRH